MKRRCLATLYGAGLSRIAPGTVGSLVAALLAACILWLPYGWITLVYGTFAFSIVGTRHASRYMRVIGTDHDPKEIVIDELAGQWLTYVFMPTVLFFNGDDVSFLDAPLMFALHLVAGFLLFRLFDILKPWPISWADRRVKGGFGVMLDDLLAAIPAGVLLHILEQWVLRGGI